MPEPYLTAGSLVVALCATARHHPRARPARPASDANAGSPDVGEMRATKCARGASERERWRSSASGGPSGLCAIRQGEARRWQGVPHWCGRRVPRRGPATGTPGVEWLVASALGAWFATLVGSFPALSTGPPRPRLHPPAVTRHSTGRGWAERSALRSAFSKTSSFNVKCTTCCEFIGSEPCGNSQICYIYNLAIETDLGVKVNLCPYWTSKN